MRHARLCRLLRGHSNNFWQDERQGPQRKGGLSEAADRFVVDHRQCERCEKGDFSPEAWLGVERRLQGSPRVSVKSIVEFVGQARPAHDKI